MYKEYIQYHKTYTSKYGPKTAIFLLVGSFYELYDIENPETGETACNVREIADHLGLQLKIKKGDISCATFGNETDNNGLWAGFPDYVLHKWAGRLTSVGWTVVIVDQVKDSKGKVRERKVSRILSPSTHIENSISTDTPYVVTIYFNNTTGAPTFGVGSLDLTTGTTTTYFGSTSGYLDMWSSSELTQFLNVFQPREIVIYWNSTKIPDVIFFRKIFDIPQIITLHIRSVDSTSTFSKELVQTEYLRKIYSIKSLLPPKIYLGLRSGNEVMALMYLLQFAEEHYPSMIKFFHRNESWTPHTRLICGNNALVQLQMTGINQNETVIGIFDKSITSMGKRAIRDRLLNPFSHPEDIINRLEEVKNFMTWSEDKTKLLDKQLRFMSDIPRLHRRLLCGLITPQEIVGLFRTYSAIDIIISNVTINTNLQQPFPKSEWIDYIETFKLYFKEEKSQNANENISPFNDETYETIRKKELEISGIIKDFEVLRLEFLSDISNISGDSIKLVKKDKEPYGLKCSGVAIEKLSKLTKSGVLPVGTKLTKLSSGGWANCEKLQKLNLSLSRLQKELEIISKECLVDACLKISESSQQIWGMIEYWICHVDCTQCIGKIAKEKGYVCPIIMSNDSSASSSLDIKQLRHPLVEASSSRISYVKHDISLDDNIGGWLVYGPNASGKSTLMKAVGVCVLLAQSGCFVPAKEMIIRPFKSIYTRILNNDNLFAGLSSFAVEMLQLREIDQDANQNTLVLGDELCSGTETVSAQSLVASGIETLYERKSKFIFATHLHGIPDVVDTEAFKVKVCHINVEREPVTNKLIYDRTLKPGRGPTIYGLEVAKAMDLSPKFIEKATKYRYLITGSVKPQDAKPSSWNSDIVRKECELCGTTIVSELEVHHINERKNAVNKILPDGSHMNDKRNLMVLCESCHHSITMGALKVTELIETSDGPERIVTKKSKNGKWTDKELKIISETLNEFPKLSLVNTKKKLFSEYSITISEPVLSKMKKEKMIFHS